MSNGRVRRDLAVLAGELPHRGACTNNERTAAEYIRDRFSTHVADVELDEFHAMDTPLLVFASYYGEFLVVALLAILWPWVAFGYGIAVFIMYFAEISGYHILARVLPQYETQNVVARILARRPKKLVIVTANYDSPRETIVERPTARSWLRTAHLWLIVCMIGVIVTCVADAYGVFAGGFRYDLLIRWSAVGCLVTAASAFVVAELTAEYGGGGNDNASGVAAILGLAEQIASAPLEETDVWLVATGAKRGWLSGIRRFVSTHGVDAASTTFVNVHAVGNGQLRCVTREGLLYAFPSEAALHETALRVGEPFGVTAMDWSGWPTDGYYPRTRGFRVIGVTSEPGAADPGTADERVNPDAVARAEAYVLALLCGIDGKTPINAKLN